MIFRYQLAVILIIGKLLFASGEWVEMPQFSDGSKIYKLSSPNKHTSFYNEFTNNYDGNTPEYGTKITGDLSNEFDDSHLLRKNSTNRVVSYNTEEKEGVSSDSAAQLTTIISPQNLYEKFIIDENDDIVNVSKENIDTTNSDLREISSSITDSSISASSVTLELPIEEELSSTFTTIKPISTVNYPNETIITDDVKFENYLPMEMLKKVHRILKSQPSTMSGKIQFLKRFEKDLISEIEKRLSVALAPTRQTRGAHDYYDHDEEIGFPSLEGALMSISFLTFAVYLVRLVMLLFRNTNDSSTAATVFFGRNRRSTDYIINDNSEEILNYLNTFDAY